MKHLIEAPAPMPKRRLTDDEYEFVFQRAVRLCVDCLIVQEGGLLLAMREIQPFKGYWTLPGGMVRYKETVDEAFDRVILNELGIKCIEKKLLGYIDSHDDGPWLQSISLAFLTEFEGQLCGSDQGQLLQFFTRIPERTQPYQAEFFRQNWELIVG